MRKKIIIFLLFAFTLIWAAPAFAQPDPLYYTIGPGGFYPTPYEQRQQFQQNRKPMIDPDGNPINGYNDTRTKEDEARAAKETFEYAKKIIDDIKSFFSAGGQQPNKARQAQQSQPKGRNSSKRPQNKKNKRKKR